jgi:hypothetical protein
VRSASPARRLAIGAAASEPSLQAIDRDVFDGDLEPVAAVAVARSARDPFGKPTGIASVVFLASSINSLPSRSRMWILPPSSVVLHTTCRWGSVRPPSTLDNSVSLPAWFFIAVTPFVVK